MPTMYKTSLILRLLFVLFTTLSHSAIGVAAEPVESVAVIVDKFVVAMHAGTFNSEAAAIADARLTPDMVPQAEFESVSETAKIRIYGLPKGVDNSHGMIVLIIESAENGAYRMWFGATALARPTRVEAEKVASDIMQRQGGNFRVFERK